MQQAKSFRRMKLRPSPKTFALKQWNTDDWVGLKFAEILLKFPELLFPQWARGVIIYNLGKVFIRKLKWKRVEFAKMMKIYLSVL